MTPFVYASLPEPIELPDGRILNTVSDAIEFIDSLPADVRSGTAWQTARENLLIASDRRGWMFVAVKTFREAMTG